MNIYVGNLPYSVRDNDLLALFSEYGNVSSAKVIMDRETDRSKGFGFVEMPSADEPAAEKLLARGRRKPAGTTDKAEAAAWIVAARAILNLDELVMRE